MSIYKLVWELLKFIVLTRGKVNIVEATTPHGSYTFEIVLVAPVGFTSPHDTPRLVLGLMEKSTSR